MKNIDLCSFKGKSIFIDSAFSADIQQSYGGELYKRAQILISPPTVNNMSCGTAATEHHVYWVKEIMLLFCLEILTLLQLLCCCYHYLYCTLLPHKLNATSSLPFSGGCSIALWEIYGKARAELDKAAWLRVGTLKCSLHIIIHWKHETSETVSLSKVRRFRTPQIFEILHPMSFITFNDQMCFHLKKDELNFLPATLAYKYLTYRATRDCLLDDTADSGPPLSCFVRCDLLVNNV